MDVLSVVVVVSIVVFVVMVCSGYCGGSGGSGDCCWRRGSGDLEEILYLSLIKLS
jgi:hypothetical protein